VALSQYLPTALSFLTGSVIALIGSGRAAERLYQAISWETLIYIGSFTAIGKAAADLGLLTPVTPYLSNTPLLYAVGIALSNTLGAVPTATLLGPLIHDKNALLAVVASIMPIALPLAHPAVYLAYRQSDTSLATFLKASTFTLAATAVATYPILYLLPL
jgi:di/tricarboxylate transporter